MELEDEEINAFRVLMKGPDATDDNPICAKIDALCDMAIAANAAKRQEPWYSADIPLEYITKAADGTQFRNVCPLPAHAIAWQVAAPPDLAAKLKEARETIQFMLEHSEERGMSADAYEKANDFLARTK